MDNLKLIKYLIGGVVGLILFSLLAPFTTIPAGSRGVVTHFGKVQDEVLDEGIHFTVPIATTVHKISTRVQKSEDDTEAATRDIQKVRAKIAINWHVDSTKVNTLYQQVGNESDVDTQVISPAVSETLKAATAKMTAEEVLTKRIELKNDIDQMLIKRLARYSIVVDDISLTNLEFTAEFNHAVEQKQIAEQEAQRAEYVRQRAKKDAEATVETAKGQAASQQLTIQSLTPAILQKLAIDKWDGKFPQYMGGSGPLPFINLKSQKAGE